jgi:AbrB family looped-hinge helix DNA binding protein
MRRTYTIQENGQVTLPAEWREKHNIKKGDVVSFEETDEGLLITPRRLVAMALLDEIAEGLKAKGITLDELLDAGQDIRQQIYDEKYKAKDTSS